jgi:hypothetical protein
MGCSRFGQSLLAFQATKVTKVTKVTKNTKKPVFACSERGRLGGILAWI